MVVGSVLALVWTRLLLRAMGDHLNGLFLAFQAVTSLGGLGDLGMGGAVALRSGQLLGQGDESRLRVFLANARALFMTLAFGVFALMIVLSPWLPGILDFKNLPGAGSLHALFIAGAAGIGLLIINSYFQNLNHAHGTVVWPILPALILTQVALATHWGLARAGLPLWVQYLPYLGIAAAGVLLAKAMLDWSHPWLGKITPLRFGWSEWRSLLSSSGWVYLCSLGSILYMTTGRMVINAGFGPEIIPAYQYNYKLCELAVVLGSTASFVGMPRITQWLASANTAERARAVSEVQRLNQFQVVLGCAASLAYLAINDFFITVWLGPNYRVPFAWQTAFAVTLAVTTAGDAGVQVSGRCGARGLRAAGIAIGGAGILNLFLAIVSAKLGSITGIAWSAALSQSALGIVLGCYTSRYLGIPGRVWVAKSWLLPLGVVSAAGLLKHWLPGQSFAHISLLMGCYALLLLGACAFVGVTREMLRAELAIIRNMVKK
jgi:O-antigen/teichoic acid export membrane protein